MNNNGNVGGDTEAIYFVLSYNIAYCISDAV